MKRLLIGFIKFQALELKPVAAKSDSGAGAGGRCAHGDGASLQAAAVGVQGAGAADAHAGEHRRTADGAFQLVPQHLWEPFIVGKLFCGTIHSSAGVTCGSA